MALKNLRNVQTKLPDLFDSTNGRILTCVVKSGRILTCLVWLRCWPDTDLFSHSWPDTDLFSLAPQLAGY